MVNRCHFAPANNERTIKPAPQKNGLFFPPKNIPPGLGLHPFSGAQRRSVALAPQPAIVAPPSVDGSHSTAKETPKLIRKAQGGGVFVCAPMEGRQNILGFLWRFFSSQ